MRERPDPTALSPRASAWLRSRSRSAGWVPEPAQGVDVPDDEPEEVSEPEEWVPDRPRVRLPATVAGARWQPGRSAVLGVVVLAVLAALVLGLRVASASSDGDVVAPGGGARAGPVGVSAGAVDVGVPTDSAPASSGPAASPSVSPSPSAQVVVHVVGRVRRPGVRTLPAGSRVADAVRAAGGVSGGADLAALNLARVLVDGEQVRVPAPGEVPTTPPTAPGGSGSGSGGGGASAGPATPVSLSTADVGALDGLPGIGPVLAQRIVDWRTAHGRFTSVDELTEVSGIGDRLLEQLRPLVVP
ncbi:ComEA family DNA-binding protein [Arthrobacter sp. NEB 688]|uniref:ComEA family DNA-binding protein n=1 Tax=Arthrobacter sp. NEB 688 TaxID=904039 RepID=UPI001565DE5D|nr:ComEA family DNA-binding protein [Arthrobacter sp. NEB 688]QKE84360.1 ComEA family DNA-binding protein [Arthrobacter sp. NEB 688]